VMEPVEEVIAEAKASSKRTLILNSWEPSLTSLSPAICELGEQLTYLDLGYNKLRGKELSTLTVDLEAGSSLTPSSASKSFRRALDRCIASRRSTAATTSFKSCRIASAA
jgi:hypothetical protein